MAVLWKPCKDFLQIKHFPQTIACHEISSTLNFCHVMCIIVVRVGNSCDSTQIGTVGNLPERFNTQRLFRTNVLSQTPGVVLYLGTKPVHQEHPTTSGKVLFSCVLKRWRNSGAGRALNTFLQLELGLFIPRYLKRRAYYRRGRSVARTVKKRFA